MHPTTKRILLAAAATGILLILAGAMPLTLYTISLACFGLAHVAYELRYVDTRFGRRLLATHALGLLSLGLGIMTIRSLFVVGLWSPQWRAYIEVLALAVFAGAAFGCLPSNARWPRSLAALVVFLLGAGALWAPVLTLALFSLLHNATPIGFVVEAAPSPRKTETLLKCCLVFLGIPALAALPFWDQSPLLLGEADAFVASNWLEVSPGEHARRVLPRGPSALWVPRLFRAAVVAQVLHYFATICWLPRLNQKNQDQAHRFPWPSPKLFALGVTVSSLLLLVAYFASFRNAQAFYSVPAAFHAWLEVPILLIALGGTKTAKPANQRKS